MKIIGIDPGINTCGYGILQKGGREIKLLEGGTIKTRAKDSMEKKLLTIYNNLNEILEEFDPSVMAIEDLYSHYKMPKTSIIMGHARGVIFLAAAMRDIPVESYSATNIKKSLTGFGRASKEQMQMAIKTRMGLSQVPKPHDVADALATALCHVNHIHEEEP